MVEVHAQQAGQWGDFLTNSHFNTQEGLAHKYSITDN